MYLFIGVGFRGFEALFLCAVASQICMIEDMIPF